MRSYFPLAGTPVLLATLALTAAAAPPPSAEVALRIRPIHPVEYSLTDPTAAEVKSCRVEKEVVGKASSWLVRDAQGQMLRRFADTNADLQVDVWCYYRDGLEVYRDIDTNFDRKADQHRWFNTGGSRWGLDTDQDETIDRWRQISPREVGEQLVAAIQARDQQAFESLLLSTAELNSLKLPAALRSQFLTGLREAPSAFKTLANRQTQITRASRCVDFGAARPGALPRTPGEEGPEVVVYEGASALVETAGKTDQLQLGVLVRVGDAWRMVEAPQLGGDAVEVSGVFALVGSASTTGVAPPSDKVQQLMADLEKLDQRMASVSPQERAKLVPQREKQLLALAAATEEPTLREQWYTQLADGYSSAAMEGYYPAGVKCLGELEQALAKQGASDAVMAHVRYLRIWCDWVLQNQDPKQEYGKVQENWIKQLRAFVKAYPDTEDTAEAYLQLGMTQEFAGDTDDAIDWYTKLATEFSGTPRGEKGRGAVRRLDSVGKRIRLSGPTLRGGAVDLGDYRGKHVLVQYWATWYEPSKTDMAVIQQAYNKYQPRGFEVLGVCLDASAADANAFLRENRYPWRHLYDNNGLEGRLATEMGVMTLPLMMLVDDQGKVVNRNVHASELDAELKRLIK